MQTKTFFLHYVPLPFNCGAGIAFTLTCTVPFALVAGGHPDGGGIFPTTIRPVVAQPPYRDSVRSAVPGFVVAGFLGIDYFPEEQLAQPGQPIYADTREFSEGLFLITRQPYPPQTTVQVFYSDGDS